MGNADTARRNLKLALDAKKKRYVPTFFTCKKCGKEKQCKPREVRLGLKKYCSMECMSDDYKTRLKGASNPNFKNAGHKTCIMCKQAFFSYSKSRIFCSLECRDRKNALMPHYGAHRVDKNQKEIVAALESVGASVMDTSDVGGGMPDLVVGFQGVNVVMEVKNPKNRYGRQGLTKRQQKWADAWNGSPVVVVYTVEDALRAIGIKNQI